jgi:hypothetical protein
MKLSPCIFAAALLSLASAQNTSVIDGSGLCKSACAGNKACESVCDGVKDNNYDVAINCIKECITQYNNDINKTNSCYTDSCSNGGESGGDKRDANTASQFQATLFATFILALAVTLYT